MVNPVPVPVTSFPAAGALDGTEEVPVVKAGITSRTTAQAIADLGGGGAVDSVNGQTGVVVLDAADVGAVATSSLPLAIASGGTGSATANDALNALLPNQAGQAGKVLGTDGANASWVASGGGSVPTPLVVQLSPLSQGSFNGVSFSDWDNATVLQASTDAHWDNAAQNLVFDVDGLYEITASCLGTSNSTWPDDLALYGTRIDGSMAAQYARYQKLAEGSFFMDSSVQWVAESWVQATAAQVMSLGLYASSYASSADLINFSLTLSVKRISP